MKIGENRSIFGETPSKSIVNPSFLRLPTSKSSNFLHVDSIFDHFRELIFRKFLYIMKFENPGNPEKMSSSRRAAVGRRCADGGATPRAIETPGEVKGRSCCVHALAARRWRAQSGMALACAAATTFMVVGAAQPSTPVRN